MSLGKRRKKILDGEVLFKYYYLDMGNARSYPKLAKWATERWGRNPENGKEWSNGAVWQAAWRWVFENMNSAKEIYRQVSLNFFLSVIKVNDEDAVWSDKSFDEEWLETVSRHAKTCMTPTQYRRFLAKHPELKPYEFL